MKDQDRTVFRPNLKSNSLIGTLKLVTFPQCAGTALQESQPTLDQDTDHTSAEGREDGWQGLRSLGTSRH